MPNNGKVKRTTEMVMIGNVCVEVGKPHSIMSPRDQDETYIVSVERGYLSIDFWFAPPLEREIGFLNGLCVQVGVFVSRDCLAPMFVFQANGKDLLLGGPHSSSSEGANQYIADAFGSAQVAYLTMMGTRTGIVRAMRHLVLPPSFVAAMKKGLGGVPGHDGPSIESWVGIGNTAGAWTSKNTMRWTWDDRRKEFRAGLKA